MSVWTDFHPLFSLFDDHPLFAQVTSRTADPYAVARPVERQQQQEQQVQRQASVVRTPRLHVQEEDAAYVVDCELPGVRKENLEVDIGDGGRSVTIKGTTGASSRMGKIDEVPANSSGAAPAAAPAAAKEGPTTDANAGNQGSQTNEEGERWFYKSSFSRTIWLPRPVDPTKVKAKLDHGVLTLEIPKKEEPAARRITID
jgi:HSP20 family molecular chaperone IbpA